MKQASLSAKTDKLREKSEKIKEGLEQKKEAFSELTNKTAESINERLVRPPHLLSLVWAQRSPACRYLTRPPPSLSASRPMQRQSGLKKTRSSWNGSGR